MSNVKGQTLIFDMDGVIINSEMHWNSDELSMLKKAIPTWTEEDHARIIGLNIFDTYKVLSGDYGLQMTENEFIKSAKRIANHIYSEKAELMPDFHNLIELVSKNGKKIGLASSSLREWIEIVLERFKLKQYFDITVSAEEINAPGKPAPDIYLHTAKLLKTDPRACTVIEDSKNGVTAAKAAGMRVIGFRNGFNEAQNLSKSDEIINGFKEFDITEWT